MIQANPFADLVPGAPPATPSGAPEIVVPRGPTPQTAAQARETEANATIAERTAGGPAPIPSGRLTDQQRLDIISRRDALRGFERTIDELETLYGENLEGSQGGIFGIAGERNPRASLPLAPTGYATFDSASGRIIDQIIQTFDITGGEANSVAELRARFGPYMPASTDNDQTIQSKLETLRNILEERRAAVAGQMRLAGIPVEDQPAPETRAVPPGAAPPTDRVDRTERTVTATGTEPRQELSSGDEEARGDPNRERVNTEAQRRLTQMLRSGVPDAEIRSYGNSLGINVDDALQFRRSPDWRRWRQQNPNQLYPFEDRGANIPMSGLSSAVAGAAASPVGTAAIHYANAASAGAVPLVGDLMGTGEQTRLGLAATRRENPGSALLGEVAGGATAYGLGGRVAQRVAPNFLAGRPASRAMLGDFAYGGVYGLGENHDPISGAAEALVGGRLAHGASRALASTVSPTGGSLRSLYDEGTRPTVGQRFRESGPVGGAVNLVEEGAQSIPGVGQIVRAGRQGARDQWERGGWNMTLENIGEALPADVPLGPQAHRYAQQTFNDAYDRVRANLSFTPDTDWATDLATVRADASLLTGGVRQRFNRIATDLEQRISQSGGAMNGNQFKAAASELNTEIRRLRNLRNPTQGQRELLSTLDELDSALHDGARRSSAPEAVAELDRVDRGYAMLTRIEEASRRRPRSVGRFTPSDVLQVEARNGGARGRRFSAGEGMFADYADQGQSLEDILPTSGTSERAALMATLGTGAAAATGAGGAYALGVEPETIGGVAALPFILNTPGIRSAMAPRGGDGARWFADWLRRQRLAGGAGAAAASYGNERD